MMSYMYHSQWHPEPVLGGGERERLPYIHPSNFGKSTHTESVLVCSIYTLYLGCTTTLSTTAIMLTATCIHTEYACHLVLYIIHVLCE